MSARRYDVWVRVLSGRPKRLDGNMCSCPSNIVTIDQPKRHWEIHHGRRSSPVRHKKSFEWQTLFDDMWHVAMGWLVCFPARGGEKMGGTQIEWRLWVQRSRFLVACGLISTALPWVGWGVSWNHGHLGWQTAVTPALEEEFLERVLRSDMGLFVSVWAVKGESLPDKLMKILSSH